MKFCLQFTLALVVCSWSTRGESLDQIRTHNKETVRGQITEISPTEVKIDKNPIEATIPVNEIISISFDGEPDELAKGRNLAISGQYVEALEALKRTNRDEVKRRKEMEQQLDFYTAYCATKLALGGAGSINTAGPMLLTFIKNNPSSYHYLEAAELMGDLYVNFGMEAQRSSDKSRQAKAPQSFESAMEYYAIAGKAPWAGAEVGLNLKRGRALLAQKKHAEAVKAFQSVLTGAAGPKAESLKLAATLGKATALANDGQAEQGIKLVEEVIAKAPKSDSELLGQAYLTLGNCHQAAKMPREAVMDYLHVDLLYFQNPQTHSEALAALGQLWQTLNRPDRAREANARLARMYPNSIWAK